MFKLTFPKLSRFFSPTLQQFHLPQNTFSLLPTLSLTNNLNFNFSNSSRNNRNNKQQQLTLAPSSSAKLTKYDVEIQTKGTIIEANFQGRTVTYDCKINYNIGLMI